MIQAAKLTVNIFWDKNNPYDKGFTECVAKFSN